MTRAIRLTRTGGPEVLELEEISLPEPKVGEARVRHYAIGVNFIDTYQRSGLYPIPLPSGLGSEAAGVVEQVGPGVTNVRVGERVAYAASGAPAAYAEARIVAAERLVPLPDGLKGRDRATLPAFAGSSGAPRIREPEHNRQHATHGLRLFQHAH